MPPGVGVGGGGVLFVVLYILLGICFCSFSVLVCGARVFFLGGWFGGLGMF